MSSPSPEQAPKPRWSLSLHAEWRGGWPTLAWRGSAAGASNRETATCPRPWRALRTYAILLAIAFALLRGGDFLLDRFPTRVGVAGNGRAAAVSIGGTTRAVTLDQPIKEVRFPPAEPYRREYTIDGSDSTNNGTISFDYLAAIADTPYYRFQAWLRDEGSYSSWRDLIMRDAGEYPFIRQARPLEGEAMEVPSEFEIAVDLRRIEIPRTIELLDENGGKVRIEINRNDKAVYVVNVPTDEPETLLAKWYFAREWRPELALILYLLMRICAIGIFLLLLLAPIAALLPGHLPRLPERAVRVVGLGTVLSVTLGASAYISVVVFDMMPHILDAQGYYFQAKTFAAGMLSAPAPPAREAFDVPFTVYREGRWFTMYTPGTALLLAVGVKAGAAWLVGPLLATGGVALTYAAASRQFSWRTGLLAAALMASSPFLHLQAGSFMSHVPGMFWGAMTLYAAVRYVERRALGWAIVGATALGFLFITRELSTLIYALTLGSYVAWHTGCRAWRSRGDRPRIVGDGAAAALCLAVFAGGYLLYNRALTGSATLLPRVLFDKRDNRYGFGEEIGFYGRHTLGGGLVNADEMLTSLGIMLFGWPFYLALTLMVLPFLLRRAQTWDRVHGALAAGFVLAYIGLYYHGITFGPRYYLDALPAMVILAARGFVTLADAVATLCREAGRRQAQPRAALATGLLCLALLLCNAIYFWPQQPRIYGGLANRPGTNTLALGNFIERRIAGRVGVVPNALIITRDRGNMNILGPLNCPRLDCPTIFAYVPDDEVEAKLRTAFPNRDWYLVQNVDGVLTLAAIASSDTSPAR